MLLKLIAAFASTLTFAILFNSPKKELLLCGLTGAFAWLFYELVFEMTGSNTIPTLAGALAATLLSRFFAFRRKNPITVYLISGIIPLVPGSGIYYTVYNLIINESALAYTYGMDTIKMAGVISLGIMCVLSLPVKMFSWVAKK
ncbi:threonine/serine exporter family protein [Tyzzerella sp. OttesenSCG-928-J15]|nr:threonine/serine exporter family protein [Tyzzerella sp. OttesenSCG-928-J15]